MDRLPGYLHVAILAATSAIASRLKPAIFTVSGICRLFIATGSVLTLQGAIGSYQNRKRSNARVRDSSRKRAQLHLAFQGVSD